MDIQALGAVSWLPALDFKFSMSHSMYMKMNTQRKPEVYALIVQNQPIDFPRQPPKDGLLFRNPKTPSCRILHVPTKHHVFVYRMNIAGPCAMRSEAI